MSYRVGAMTRRDERALDRQLGRRVILDCVHMIRDVQDLYELRTSEVVKALAFAYRAVGYQREYMALYWAAEEIRRTEKYERWYRGD